MFPWMASLLVASETLVLPHVISPFIGRETYPIDVHSFQIWGWFSFPERSPFWWRASREDVVIPCSEFPELDNIPVKFSSFIKPLFPFPSSLFLAQRKGSSSHHSSQLVGDSLLEGVYQDTVQGDPATCLGQSQS